MFGRMMNDSLGKIHFWFTFIGVYAIFMPMHFLGVAGHPRRYPDTTEFEFLIALDPLHLFISIAAIITIRPSSCSSPTFYGACSGGPRPGKIPGRLLPWNGLFLHRLRMTTLVGGSRSFTMDRTSTASRAPRKIT
jgi:cytochrome c oxidase subunit 1